jgi:radical SAM protein with 4Fe4S-binding SPASM domain
MRRCLGSWVRMSEPATPSSERVPLPEALQVEVTGSCNLSCRMCLVAYRPRLGRSAHLTLASLRALLDDQPSVRELTLQGLGEPLLVPDLEAMVREASSRGIRVGLNTNGTLLTAAKSRALIAAGLDWLHVSVDGACEETFADIRVGGHLDTVLAHLRQLMSTRAELSLVRPRVQMNTVVMRRNASELDALVDLAADVGVDRLWIQGLSHDFGDVGEDETFVAIRHWTAAQQMPDDELETLLSRAALRARDLGLDLRLPDAPDTSPPRMAGEPGCDWPWRAAYVGYDGTVQPCCMVMGHARGVLGNIHEQPLSRIWQSPQYTAFRDALCSDHDPPDICRGCAVYRRRF